MPSRPESVKSPQGKNIYFTTTIRYPGSERGFWQLTACRIRDLSTVILTGSKKNKKVQSWKGFSDSFYSNPSKIPNLVAHLVYIGLSHLIFGQSHIASRALPFENSLLKIKLIIWAIQMCTATSVQLDIAEADGITRLSCHFVSRSISIKLRACITKPVFVCLFFFPFNTATLSPSKKDPRRMLT